MTHYVFARKPGTELVVGHERLVFQVADQDLSVDLGEWLQAQGWTVTLSDSTEGTPSLGNTPQGMAAVSFLTQQFESDCFRLQAWRERRASPPSPATDGRFPRPFPRPSPGAYGSFEPC